MTATRRPLRSGAVPSADPNPDRNPAARIGWHDATPLAQDAARAWAEVMGDRRSPDRGKVADKPKRRSTFL